MIDVQVQYLLEVAPHDYCPVKLCKMSFATEVGTASRIYQPEQEEYHVNKQVE